MYEHSSWFYFITCFASEVLGCYWSGQALNGLLCADVPLRNYSLTHYWSGDSDSLWPVKTSVL